MINNLDIKNSIKAAEKLIKGHGRILVRASGTESKIRVMGESENIQLLQNCLNIILRKIK
jgi:phosphoglucosamine mutase